MKKKLLVFFSVILLLLGDYLYWTLPRPLNTDLPEEIYSSVKADLIYYDRYFTPKDIEVDEAQLADILNALAQTEVTRRPKFRTMSQPFFYLYLYYPDGYTVMTVVENGNLVVTPNMYRDRHVYFDGGEELYQVLLGLRPSP